MFWKIGSGEERCPFRRHEDSKRPAAGTGHSLSGTHVDAIDIGALFTIHLDGDKMVV